MKQQTRSSLSRLPRPALPQSFTQDLHALPSEGSSFSSLAHSACPRYTAGVCLSQLCLPARTCQCPSDLDPPIIPASSPQTSPPAHPNLCSCCLPLTPHTTEPCGSRHMQAAFSACWAPESRTLKHIQMHMLSAAFSHMPCQMTTCSSEGVLAT